MGVGRKVFSSAGKVSSHVLPGAYSRIDDVGGSAGRVASNRGVILTEGVGLLKPNKLYAFSSSSQALNNVLGGVGRDAVQAVFRHPLQDTPSQVLVMLTNIATQSTGLFSLVSPSTPLIDFKSRGYGAYTANTRVKVSPNTTEGYDLEITQTSPLGIRLVEKFERAGNEELIRIKKTTTGVSSVLITSNEIRFTGTNPNPSFNIPISSTDTLQGIVQSINANATNGGVLVASLINEGTNGALIARSVLSTRTITNITQAASVVLVSQVQSIVDLINTQSSLVSASRHSTNANTVVGVGVLANPITIIFSVGVDGAVTATNYKNSLVLLESENINFISTTSTDSEVAQAVAAHCVDMSSISNRKERQFFIGLARSAIVLSEKIANAKLLASELNTSRGMVVFNGYKAVNASGRQVDFGSNIAAVALMGIKISLGVAQPLTRRQFIATEVENMLSTSHLEELIQSGVAPLMIMEGNSSVSVVRQITAFQGDNIRQNEFSAVTISDYVSRAMRVNLDKSFTGTNRTNRTRALVEAVVKSNLQEFTDDGLFAADEDGIVFYNVNVVASADAISVDYDANISLPANFFFITQHFHTEF